MKYECYIASGWFNENQAKDLELIKKTCTELGISFFSPKDEANCPPTASFDDQKKVFDGNVEAIKDCSFVIVNTRDKDLGTIFEAGYSYAIGKPILYYCEGLKGSFNLMLAQSGNAVATNPEQLKTHLVGLHNDEYYYSSYDGDIQ